MRPLLPGLGLVRQAALVMALAGLVGLLHGAGLLGPLQAGLAELRFRAAPRQPTGQVVLVDIDARSLSALGTWPWPRRLHAGLVDRLSAAGAATIAFDVDFSAASTPEGDAALEAALARAGDGVVLAAFRQSAAARQGSGGQGSNGQGNDGRSSDEPAGMLVNHPLPRLAAHAWEASVGVEPDADGAVRRFRYGETFDGTLTPSLPAFLAGAATVSDGSFLIDYSIEAGGIDRISAIDLLDGHVDARRIAGRRVIVGASAVELRDFFETPVDGMISGHTLQALAAESLIQGRALQPLPPWTTWAGLALVALVALLVQRLLPLRLALAALAGFAVLAEAGAALAQARWPVLPDTAPWQAALLVLMGLTLVREVDVRRVLIAISRREARNSRTLLDRVIADSFAGIVVVDHEGTVLAVSDAGLALLGRPASTDSPSVDPVGHPAADLLPQSLLAPLQTATARAHAKGGAVQTALEAGAEARGTAELTDPDGALRLIDYVITPSRLEAEARGRSPGAGALALCLTFQDVTEQRDAQARMAYLAHIDTLTGLPNRNLFFERLRLACATARREEREEPQDTLQDTPQDTLLGRSGLTLLTFDLDRFKAVNDTLGHHHGDLLLAEVAERLRGLGGDAAMVARLGGDEFAAIVEGPAATDRAEALARSLVERLGEPYQLAGYPAKVGASVGIAALPADRTGELAGEAGPEALMRRADAALYRAKAAGGGGHAVFDEALDAALQARHGLEQDLWEGFWRSEFRVVYQPQVDLATNEITGVEALVRWHHPRRGPVSPAEFVPAAERIGLIEPLGAYVLREACTTAAGWPKPIKVAVNLSAVQIARGDVIATVREALEVSGLPAARLDLEITESLFIGEEGEVARVLAGLKGLGTRLALDDFGTGYSSLGYLRRFPLDKLKIDKSFVDGVPHQEGAVAIVRAITGLSAGLGLRVNAEGIETPEQAALLRMVGCQEGQGWLFGKPQSGDDIARLLGGASGQAGGPAAA